MDVKRHYEIGDKVRVRRSLLLYKCRCGQLRKPFSRGKMMWFDPARQFSKYVHPTTEGTITGVELCQLHAEFKGVVYHVHYNQIMHRVEDLKRHLADPE